MKRIVLGGLVGGLIVFVWGMVAHMMLPLGHMGIGALPNVEAVASVLKDSGVEAGMYMVPNAEAGDSDEQREAWKEQYRAGPRALIVYSPEGDDPTSPKQLGMGLLMAVVAAWVACLIVAQSATFYAARLIVVTLLGVFAWLAIELPYWNWYLFPSDRIAASFVEHVVGWFLAGLAIAGIVKGRFR